MKKAGIITLIVLITSFLFIMLHSTPKMALRTHVFFMGHPIKAVQTDIKDNKDDNEFYQKELAELNGQTYILTIPPYESATDSELDTYLVQKKGFLYFPRFYSLF